MRAAELRWVRLDGCADHATARGIPEGDVVVLDPSRGDHRAVGAVPDRVERRSAAG